MNPHQFTSTNGQWCHYLENGEFCGAEAGAGIHPRFTLAEIHAAIVRAMNSRQWDLSLVQSGPRDERLDFAARVRELLIEAGEGRMKVVINRCFGGFGLSAAAEDALIGKCEHIQLIEPIEYYSGPGSPFYEANKERLSPDDWRKSYERDLRGEGLIRFHDGKVICDEHRDTANRTCAALVEVVERLGETASGQLSKLKVVEVPDDVEFEIDEYDGREHVAEAHRTWR